MTKVIVAVMCGSDMPERDAEYRMLADCIKSTWGKQHCEESKIYYLWANNYQKKDETDFVVDVTEGYGAILPKLLSFLDYIKDWDFDYVYKVNAGGYVDTKKLIEYLSDKPRNKFYSGIRGDYQGIIFASGSGLCLSKDLVNFAISKKDTFGTDHYDDVSFGRFMMRNNIELDKTHIRSAWGGYDFCYQIYDTIIKEELFDKSKLFHWRLRSADGNRKSDCDVMKKLYEELNKKP